MFKKEVVWIGSSRKDVRLLPEEVQKDLGHALREVQKGRNPENIKPLRHLESGVYEIITDDRAGTFRLVYFLKLDDFVIVLHVFQKKSKTGIETPKKEIELIRERLKVAKLLIKSGEITNE